MMLWYVLLTLLLVALAVLWCPVYVHFYYKDALRIKVKFLFFTFVFPREKSSEEVPSLQGGGCLPSPERYRPTSTLSLSGSFVNSSLFPKA